MPNEGDVSLFSSLCSHNIYLMQFNSAGLLAALRILLSSSPSTSGKHCLEGGWVFNSQRRTTLGVRPGAAGLCAEPVSRPPGVGLGASLAPPGTAWHSRHCYDVLPYLPGNRTVLRVKHLLGALVENRIRESKPSPSLSRHVLLFGFQETHPSRCVPLRRHLARSSVAHVITSIWRVPLCVWKPPLQPGVRRETCVGQRRKWLRPAESPPDPDPRVSSPPGSAPEPRAALPLPLGAPS